MCVLATWIAMVLDVARAADAAQARHTKEGGAPLGPLHGVPVTVKINVDVEGQANSNGVGVRFASAKSP